MGPHARARFHLQRHHLASRTLRQEVDLAALAAHGIVQRVASRRQLLGDDVLEHRPLVHLALIEVHRTRQTLGIPAQQHPRVGLIQLEQSGTLGCLQGSLRVAHLIAFEGHSCRRQPDEVFSVAFVTRFVVDGIQHEAPCAAVELQGQLVEDGLHVQGSRASVLLDIVPVACDEIGLDNAHRCQISPRVEKFLKRPGHTSPILQKFFS